MEHQSNDEPSVEQLQDEVIARLEGGADIDKVLPVLEKLGEVAISKKQHFIFDLPMDGDDGAEPSGVDTPTDVDILPDTAQQPNNSADI
jgi:hypothetical protein